MNQMSEDEKQALAALRAAVEAIRVAEAACETAGWTGSIITQGLPDARRTVEFILQEIGL